MWPRALAAYVRHRGIGLGIFDQPRPRKMGEITPKPVENSWFIVGLPNLRCFFPVRKLCKLSLPEGIDVPLIFPWKYIGGSGFIFL